MLAKRDAETDGLTRLRNHRAFHADLPRRRSAASTEAPLALAMLDIDDFKGVNDRFGHPVGDEVLQLLASTLARCSDAERCYRVGGEEFAALLDGDGEAAYALVDRLHGALEEAQTPHGQPVTISVGIAVHPDTADRPRRAAARGRRRPLLVEEPRRARARACTSRRSSTRARARRSPRRPSAWPACAPPRA